MPPISAATVAVTEGRRKVSGRARSSCAISSGSATTSMGAPGRVTRNRAPYCRLHCSMDLVNLGARQLQHIAQHGQGGRTGQVGEAAIGDLWRGGLADGMHTVCPWRKSGDGALQCSACDIPRAPRASIDHVRIRPQLVRLLAFAALAAGLRSWHHPPTGVPP